LRVLVELIFQSSFIPVPFGQPGRAHPGTRTQPSINTRALRLISALVTTHWPSI